MSQTFCPLAPRRPTTPGFPAGPGPPCRKTNRVRAELRRLTVLHCLSVLECITTKKKKVLERSLDTKHRLQTPPDQSPRHHTITPWTQLWLLFNLLFLVLVEHFGLFYVKRKQQPVTVNNCLPIYKLHIYWRRILPRRQLRGSLRAANTLDLSNICRWLNIICNGSNISKRISPLNWQK